MNIELDQQRKFTEQFFNLVQDASPKFKAHWDHQVRFINPSRTKVIPNFNPGSLDMLSVLLRDKFEILRKKYYAKSL